MLTEPLQQGFAPSEGAVGWAGPAHWIRKGRSYSWDMQEDDLPKLDLSEGPSQVSLDLPYW